MTLRPRGHLLGFMLPLTVLLLGACAPEDTSEPVQVAERVRRELIRPGGSTGSLPLSSVVRSGDLLFLSGVLGTRPEGGGERVERTIRTETRQALDNLGAVLALAGAGLEDVLKCTVFIADLADFAAMNEVYAEYFPESPPARTTVQAGIAGGGLIEIDCIAVAA